MIDQASGSAADKTPRAQQARSVSWLWAHLAWTVIVSIAVLALADGARAQMSAEAASRPPVSIAVLLSSRKDQCYDNGQTDAIRTLATFERDSINALGGTAGRRIELRFLDDEADAARTIQNVRTALADPQTVAILGLSHSTRAKATFDAVGEEIGASRIPFLSNIAVNSIFEKQKNVFTMQASQDAERLPVMVRFIADTGFRRVGFVGLKDAVFSEALGNGLAKRLASGVLVADHRIALAGEGLDPGQVSAMLTDLSGKAADMIVLATGTARATAIIKQLIASQITPALFITGQIDNLPEDVRNAYPNAIYQLAWDRLPEAFNERLRRSLARLPEDAWLFEGRKVAQAPGWSKGECKERPAVDRRDRLDDANLRAIGVGSQYADMVGLIGASLRDADATTDYSSLRQRLARELTSSFATDRGAYKGSFDNWSFDPQTRSASRTPFIVMLPQGLGRTQLAPSQFVRVRDGRLRRIDTLYVDIDLIRAHRVDDNEKTFLAEFYLAMRANAAASIDQIDFTNAYLDPRTNGRQITVEVLHAGGDSDAYPRDMKVYRVAGRFLFEPDLSLYPFDTQRFSIDIQPRRGDAPFIAQPPPYSARDRQVTTDGWDPQVQYVGYDEDFVPVVDAFTHQPSIAPFYKASFVWLMKRQTTDYFLRVVVPLLFILIVAYLSIFIPPSHFEAIVTIQVTALLSAVALYLSIPQLDSDTATVSDRIFVFDYMMVSAMIVISILRVSPLVAHRKWLRRSLAAIHIVAIPVIVAAMAVYVHTLSKVL